MGDSDLDSSNPHRDFLENYLKVIFQDTDDLPLSSFPSGGTIVAGKYWCLKSEDMRSARGIQSRAFKYLKNA
jgi:hypothetical protein